MRDYGYYFNLPFEQRKTRRYYPLHAPLHLIYENTRIQFSSNELIIRVHFSARCSISSISNTIIKNHAGRSSPITFFHYTSVFSEFNAIDVLRDSEGKLKITDIVLMKLEITE